MGEEADADWQDGLVEWGIEDAREWYRQQLEKAPRKKAPRPRRAVSTPSGGEHD